MKESHKYDDIIHLPHYVSSRRARMTVHDRAAQFSPFAALTGYDSVIEETGRPTDTETELTDSSVEQIDEKLQMLAENIEIHPTVTVTYFEPDRYKSGGQYVTITGQVKRVDSYKQGLLLTDSRTIPMKAIRSIQCDLFP